MNIYNKSSLIFSLNFIISGCSSKNDWICQEGKNSNGDAVQYSENVKTGEMAGYDKCQK